MYNSDRPTYPGLLKFYYKCGFPSILKGNANSVAHAIMFKWNELIMPASFSMSNVELEFHSGVRTHVGRSRQRVVDLCKVDETPLFTYVSNGKRKAGTYTINATLLPNRGQMSAKVIPNSSPIVNDHNITKHNITKDLSLPTGSGVTTRGQPEKPKEEKKRFNFTEDEDFFIKCINKSCAIMFSPKSDIQVGTVKELAKYPRYQIEAVAKKGGLRGKKHDTILEWMDKGLANFELFYASEIDPTKKDLSFAQRGVLEEKLQRLEKEFEEARPEPPSEFGPESDYKQFHMDKIWGMINITRLQLGIATQEMPDYEGKEIQDGSS